MVLVATTAVAAAAAVVVVVAVSRDDGSVATSDSLPDTVNDAAAGAASVIERVTAEGLTVRLLVTDGAAQFQPVQVPEGAPAWCVPTGMASGTIISAAAVAQSQLTLSEVAAPAGGGQLFFGGTLEDDPMWGAIVQVPPGVVLVRATRPGVEADEMEPVDGLAIVALPALKGDGALQPGGPMPGFNPWGDVDLDGTAIELVSATGERRRLDPRTDLQGPPMWTDQRCWQIPDQLAPGTGPPSELELPAPGEQPADPAAARAEVERALQDLFRAPIEEGLEFFDLIDDASGIDLSVAEQIEEGSSVAEVLSESEVTVVDLVFVSPVEAFFYYDIVGPATNLDRFGRARFVDGRWKITRGTFCQEVMAWGVFCGV